MPRLRRPGRGFLADFHEIARALLARCSHRAHSADATLELVRCFSVIDKPSESPPNGNPVAPHLLIQALTSNAKDLGGPQLIPAHRDQRLLDKPDLQRGYLFR